MRQGLPEGHVIGPAGDGGRARYRIVGGIGGGGFGLTYEAVCIDPGQRTGGLRPRANERVVVKEYFPDDGLATRRGDSVIAGADDESGNFERSLRRFKREAERLYVLSRLRGLRAARAHARPGSDDATVARIDALLANGASAPERQPGLANQLFGELPPAMAAAAEALVRAEDAPLPLVFDYFLANGTAVYVMEYLDGGALKDRIAARRAQFGTQEVDCPGGRFRLFKPVPEGDLRGMLGHLLAALDDLHTGLPGQQLIHCDIKPGNIMFRAAGSAAPVLIDFGLTRNIANERSMSGMGGTTGFSPLEIDPMHHQRQMSLPVGQRRDLPLGPWTDIYSTAVTLRALASGIEGARLTGAFLRWQAERLGDEDPFAMLPAWPANVSPGFIAGIEAGLAVLPTARPRSVGLWRPLFDGPAPGQSRPPAAAAADWGPDMHIAEEPSLPARSRSAPSAPRSRPSASSTPSAGSQGTPATPRSRGSGSAGAYPPWPADIAVDDEEMRPAASAARARPAWPDATPPPAPGLRFTGNHAIALAAIAALTGLGGFGLKVVFGGGKAPAAAVASATAPPPAAAPLIGGHPKPASPQPNPVVGPQSVPTGASLTQPVGPQTAPGPKRLTLGPPCVAVTSDGRQGPCTSAAQPSETPHFIATAPAPASDAGAGNTGGLGFARYANAARLAEARLKGLSTVDPVIITGMSPAFRAHGDDIRVGELFVSDCAGGSARQALAAANAGSRVCLISDSGADGEQVTIN